MSIGTEKKYNYTITIVVARTEITTVKDTTSYNRDRDIDMETGTFIIYDVKRRLESLELLTAFAKDALDLL